MDNIHIQKDKLEALLGELETATRLLKDNDPKGMFILGKIEASLELWIGGLDMEIDRRNNEEETDMVEALEEAGITSGGLWIYAKEAQNERN